MEVKIGMVGTFPPTDCGIASFTYSLYAELQNLDSCSVGIVRLVDADNDFNYLIHKRPIISTLRNGFRNSILEAVDALNQMDIAIIQHEFGIFGGHDGSEVLELIARLEIPSVVVLHTVLVNPTRHQRQIIEQMCAMADAVVIMSMVAYARLLDGYEVDSNKIILIPHGARRPTVSGHVQWSDRPTILTWGLIGPGKGIEWVIEAMDMIRDLDPLPKYVVVGRTHPKVLERDGESYREDLQRRIDELHLDGIVELRSGYLDKSDLDNLILTSSVVVLPYDSTDQVTSGVLIEALNARRPIVATQFSHALEVLSEGAGRLVPHRDPDAIALEIREILENPQLAKVMTQCADEIAKGLDWPAVAAQYFDLAVSILKPKVSA